MGQWVAWSYRGAVFVHGMRDSSSTPASPVKLPSDYSYAEFCDWTEESRLLISAYSNAGSSLLVVDTGGTIVRRISTTVPPAMRVAAAYRKYEHR